MKVLIKAPNNGAIEADIHNTPEALRGWVNGYVKCVALDRQWGVLANKNGVLMDMPLNVSVEGITFFGTIVFVGFDGEDFADCPLTKAELLEVIGE